MAVCKIVENRHLHHEYYSAVFAAPGLGRGAKAGQFLHLRIDERGDRILRRPFSIFDASDDSLTIAYKVVGDGTEALAKLPVGTGCDIIAPQGNGYTTPAEGIIPVAVCGGYGAAATFMLTRQSKTPGVMLLGARSANDLILIDDYKKAGWQVLVATDDGSVGTRGNVLSLLPQLDALYPGREFFFCGCGPHPMLIALAKELNRRGDHGELSIDHVMCCGIGACFACVVKVNDPGSENGWRYARSCSEGPVFALEDVYTGE